MAGKMTEFNATVFEVHQVQEALELAHETRKGLDYPTQLAYAIQVMEKQGVTVLKLYVADHRVFITYRTKEGWEFIREYTNHWAITSGPLYQVFIQSGENETQHRIIYGDAMEKTSANRDSISEYGYIGFEIPYFGDLYRYYHKDSE